MRSHTFISFLWMLWDVPTTFSSNPASQPLEAHIDVSSMRLHLVDDEAGRCRL
jgi:hypothetical protein